MQVYGINGSVVYATGDASIGEMVYVGKNRLVGEVIDIISKGNTQVIIQVFEDTTSLSVGDNIKGTGSPLAIDLGPGLMGQVFDGIGRNLNHMGELVGSVFSETAQTIQTEWQINFLVDKNQEIEPNTIIGTIQETQLINHQITSPEGGRVVFLYDSAKPIGNNEILAKIENQYGDIHDIYMKTKWSIKNPRPFREKSLPDKPLLTGQRVIDTLFPIAKGGSVAIPGGFGTGKTMTMNQIARYSDADVLVYVGCGERGNEIKGLLDDFSELKDPKTGRPLMERSVIIANTSNMPVSARESSIYTGVTIAEYYRDMGYHVVLIADSTSRFAEGLRELSGRLMEMPAEEGYPAYLSGRLAAFYERSGYTQNLNGSYGSVTIMGTVSPQGGDMNDVVTLATKRYVRCLWELDRNLAYARHFPAINYHNSYSEYLLDMENWYRRNAPRNFLKNREQLLLLLTEGKQLEDIAKLIGEEVLHDKQKLTLEVCQIIKSGFLSQNSMIKKDAYTNLETQGKIIEIFLYLYQCCQQLVDNYIPISVIKELGIFEKIKYIKDSDYTYTSDLNVYFEMIDNLVKNLEGKYVA